ncbi:ferredoxin [Thermosulfuriphilus ammonigenes]|uniref:Ferredoxin n=1 Tax=Thermosulfuriphilus ammonigenes TaxID=1936021 RepID=A0A6G7PU73_9BACT|nr:ferredoxin [Thermosulfuriphilus ammonigenes]MBA2848628.1 ferredoxin [Thermosulfuriphilus ammonigenes]QIJ71234.1 ferredoxin [Thermosulfuriphilus ammonigenes]HFB84088.1 ferredoxin [Thermodesulfatator sp.]
MARLVVDRELCIGCGTCVELCPEVFELDEEEKSQVKDEEACSRCDCQEAIDTCPVEAISWQE